MAPLDVSTGVGVAGLTLQAGGIPGVLDIVPTISQGLQYLSDSMTVGEEHFSIRLAIQDIQSRLAYWTVKSGWASGSLNSGELEAYRLNYIDPILADVLSRYKDIEKVMSKYGKINLDPDGETSQQDSTAKNHIAGLHDAITERDDEIQRIQELNPAVGYRRYQFTSIDRGSVRSNLIRIVDHLDRLDWHRKEILQYLVRRDEDDDIQQILDIQNCDIPTLLKYKQDYYNSGQDEMGRVVGRIARSREAETQRVKLSSSGATKNDLFRYLLEKQSVTSRVEVGDGRSIGVYDGRAVMVERRPVKTTDSGDVANATRVLNLQLALDIFCAKLDFSKGDQPEALRTLHCMGHLNLAGDENHFDLVFALPLGGGEIKVKTLESLIKNSKVKAWATVSDRLTLSYMLATSLLCIHRIGWLHKNIRPSNIIFLADKSKKISIREPYVCGFTQSRPEDEVELSAEYVTDENEANDFYRHPNCRGGRTSEGSFKRSYDIYALGIVLTIIGHWAEIGTAGYNIWEKMKEPEKFHECLAYSEEDGEKAFRHSPVHDLGFRLDKKFQGVVKACLGGGFEGNDGLKRFQQEVVLVLKDLSDLAVDL